MLSFDTRPKTFFVEITLLPLKILSRSRKAHRRFQYLKRVRGCETLKYMEGITQFRTDSNQCLSYETRHSTFFILPLLNINEVFILSKVKICSFLELFEVRKNCG